MNEEEIKSYNYLCAKFLKIITDDGYWVEFDELMPNILTMSYNKRHHIEQLQFHLDWNWIIKVIEAIEKLDYLYFQIELNACYVYDISEFNDYKCDPIISYKKISSLKKIKA
jgi:hypothetical protein